MKTQPNLIEYDDYRSFLEDFFEYSKSKNGLWSYQAWAQKLGLNDSSSLLKIINGNRDAGPKIQQKLLDYFEFSELEATYFNDLVKLSKLQKDYRDIRHSMGQKKKLLHFDSSPFNFSEESMTIEQLLKKLKILRCIDYELKDDFHFRSLIQFSLKQESRIFKDYFQEQVVLRREGRVYCSTAHFLKKTNGKFQVFADTANSGQVIINRFVPEKDDNIDVQYSKESFPTYKLYIHSINETVDPKSCLLEFSEKMLKLSGGIDKTFYLKR